MRAAGVVVLVGLLLTSGCVADDPVEPEGAVLRLELDACRPGVGTRATAVAIGDGRALTAAHPFDEVEGVRVVAADGTSADAIVTVVERDRDFAILRFDDATFSPDVRQGLDLDDDVDRSDDSVRIVVHRDDGPMIQTAEVLRRANVRLDGVGRRAAIELETTIRPGDSGAPVVADDGRIIGIVFATSRGVEAGWAIASSELIPALDAEEQALPLTCG